MLHVNWIGGGRIWRIRRSPADYIRLAITHIILLYAHYLRVYDDDGGDVSNAPVTTRCNINRGVCSTTAVYNIALYTHTHTVHGMHCILLLLLLLYFTTCVWTNYSSYIYTHTHTHTQTLGARLVCVYRPGWYWSENVVYGRCYEKYN